MFYLAYLAYRVSWPGWLWSIRPIRTICYSFCLSNLPMWPIWSMKSSWSIRSTSSICPIWPIAYLSYSAFPFILSICPFGPRGQTWPIVPMWSPGTRQLVNGNRLHSRPPHVCQDSYESEACLANQGNSIMHETMKSKQLLHVLTIGI